MMKRLAAIAAMSLVAFQAVSGVALGATEHLGSGTVPLVGGLGNCPGDAVLGVLNVNVKGDVTFSVDMDTDELKCDSTRYDIDEIERVIVYGQSKGGVDVTFDLADAHGGTETQIGDFQGIDFTVRTNGLIVIDGAGVTDDRDDFEVALEDDAFSVDEADLDVAITYADNYEVEGGVGDDVIDGRKVTAVGFEVTGGGDGNDKIYGGAGDDTLNCGDDLSALDLSGDGFADQCWGGKGDDEITLDGDVVAPGDGDDDIAGVALAALYVDSSAAVSIDATDGDVESSAGDDRFDDPVGSWTGSSKADTFHGSDDDDTFSGGAGADKAWGGKGNDTLRGGLGDDVLKGGSGADKLRGDGGSDQAWGGRGKDACGAEITDSCEFFKN